MDIGQRFNPFKLLIGSFIPNCISKIEALSPTSKLVYGRLSQYAGENGECYPSFKKLSTEICAGRRTIMTAIKELEDYGLIRVIPRTNAGGGHSSNAYEFLWHSVYENEIKGGAVSALPNKNGTTPGAVSAPLIIGLRESGLRESNNSAAVAAQPSSSEIPATQKTTTTKKQTIPQDKIRTAVLGFKIAMGIPADDKGWDAENFGEVSVYAKKMLIYFALNENRVLKCIEDIVKDFSANGLTWRPAAVCRWKEDWQAQVVTGKYRGVGKAVNVGQQGGDNSER